MELKRFYGSKLGNSILLVDREFFHCVKVTRHKTGYSIICCVGDGKDYFCTIEKITSDTVYCSIDETKVNESETRSKLVLCQALCKEFDFVVQKAVELGVTDIVPYISERTNTKKYSEERVESIILDAAKQCGRAVLPNVHELKTFDEVINAFKAEDNRIFCYENERDFSIDKAIINAEGSTVIIIGSEGGFTEEEVLKAKKSGYCIVTLGRRILRVETAAITSLVLALNALGDIC